MEEPSYRLSLLVVHREDSGAAFVAVIRQEARPIQSPQIISSQRKSGNTTRTTWQQQAGILEECETMSTVNTGMQHFHNFKLSRPSNVMSGFVYVPVHALHERGLQR